MATVIPNDPYSTVRMTAENVKGPGEWGPFRCACPAVPGHGRSVSVIEGIERGWGVIVLCERGCKREAVLEGWGLVEKDVRVPRERPKATKVTPANGGSAERALRVRSMDEITMRPIRWAWFPWLALGKVTVLAGAAGQGKSQFSLLLAARVTTGELPNDLTRPKDVIVITGEDDPEDTIKPRLHANGADMSRVFIVDVRNADGSTDLLSFPTDAGLLRDVVRKRDVGLISLDPILAFMDESVSTYRNSDVRRALAPLKLLAEENACVSLAVSHFKKGGSGGDALDQVIDSSAFTQLARTVLMMGPDPEDEEGTRGQHKVMVVAKSNIAPPGDHALALTVTPTHVIGENGEHIGTSTVQLEGRSEHTAEDLFLSIDDRDDLSQARRWVRTHLADAWRPRTEIDEAAGKAKIKPRTLRRALKAEAQRKKEAGVEHGSWYWTIKTSKVAPPWEQDPPDPRWPENRTRQVGQVGQVEDQEGQGGQVSEDESVATLRERDRRLGERWEDE